MTSTLSIRKWDSYFKMDDNNKQIYLLKGANGKTIPEKEVNDKEVAGSDIVLEITKLFDDDRFQLLVNSWTAVNIYICHNTQ